MWMNVKTKDLVELGKTGPEGSVGLEEMARLECSGAQFTRKVATKFVFEKLQWIS